MIHVKHLWSLQPNIMMCVLIWSVKEYCSIWMQSKKTHLIIAQSTETNNHRWKLTTHGASSVTEHTVKWSKAKLRSTHDSCPNTHRGRARNWTQEVKVLWIWSHQSVFHVCRRLCVFADQQLGVLHLSKFHCFIQFYVAVRISFQLMSMQ